MYQHFRLMSRPGSHLSSRSPFTSRLEMRFSSLRSILIRGFEKTILFDVGQKGEVLLMGGFRLLESPDAVVKGIIDKFKENGVRRTGALHLIH